ncbi:MAG: hypothetical protein HETSPECPRED_009571 [Heterodermia speciosa]|uniref:Zn(2)-C6 fungal-type domain-containing protein n=1 Tax=Heterodermia speciosa TaxID=116794 RepID=A0A8H3ERA5_9LECA|nr:MAG: hypothetical protein HETSPECPRED_009571 [Heterodermia speciosa]
MPVLSGCATCKGRAISCDRTKPNCTNCSRSNRKCQWHSLKLSWPGADDRRRAVVSKSSPSSSPAQGRISDARFVHTTYWDMELYHNLIGSVPVRTLSLPKLSTCWKSSELEIRDSDLLEYSSASLATFGQDTTNLGRFLLRISLEGKTASAAALFQALIAFSSLHRYGIQSQAAEAKIAALANLAQGSFEPSFGAIGAIQHIGTGMLLCSFEVHQASCASGQWTQYLEGVKTVIKASSIKTLLQFSPDVAVLLDWLHYHDVLARFSLLHWRREGAPEAPFTPADHFCPQISNLPPLILSMLNLLSQVCDTVSSSAISPESSDDVHDHKSFVEVLDWRIRSLPIPKVTEDSDDATLEMKLYQLAMLLYLNRSSEGLIDQPVRTQQQIDQAFTILPRLSSYKQHFPIYIIGCESRTDEQRAVVLDVILRTEKLSSSRSFNHCKRLLQASWAQDDLAEWNNLSYRSKLSSTMGLAEVVPAFV